MTPIEAWHIISANLWELYKRRKTDNFKGWTDADTEAEVIAFMALKTQMEWISVTDALPSEDGKYLVCTTKGAIFCTRYYAKPKHFGENRNTHITHWLPLPEPPRNKFVQDKTGVMEDVISEIRA